MFNLKKREKRYEKATTGQGKKGQCHNKFFLTPWKIIHFLQDAIVKKHSTFTEAIQEGKDMGAKFTLLTHFSQRYSKLPLLEEIEGKL